MAKWQILQSLHAATCHASLHMSWHFQTEYKCFFSFIPPESFTFCTSLKLPVTAMIDVSLSLNIVQIFLLFCSSCFVSTVFHHFSCVTCSPSPFSPPLSSPSHIYAFISHLGLVEQYKQHDEHVQRDRWLWQRKGERRDPAQCQLQLQDRRSQCPCERMSQPGSRRWEEAAHRCVREHARTHTHNGVRGLRYNLLCVLVAGMWRLTCCQISPDRARGRRASRPTPLTLFSTRLCGCVRGKLNES